MELCFGSGDSKHVIHWYTQYIFYILFVDSKVGRSPPTVGSVGSSYSGIPHWVI